MNSTRLKNLLTFLIERAMSPFVRIAFTVSQNFSDMSYVIRRKLSLVKDYDVDVASRSSSTYAIVSVFSNKTLPDTTVDYIVELSKQDLDIHVVCNGFLSDAAISKLTPYVHKISCRENIGRDFCGYKYGVESAMREKGVERILITNDSCFVVTRRLNSLFTKMNNASADFWGITESKSPIYHLQSFFIMFNRPVIESAVFKKYWTRYPYNSSRHFAVKHGEIGLTKTLTRKGGFRPAAFNTVSGLAELIDRSTLTGLIKMLGYISQLNIASASDASLKILQEVGISRREEVGVVVHEVWKVRLRRHLLDEVSQGSDVHGAGMLYLRYCDGLLLKKDLVLKNIYSVTELDYQLSGLDIGLNTPGIISFFKMKGGASEQKLFDRILLASGHK